jgi:hypothetical protein
MGRPVKDYWNWQKVTIKYNSGDWKKPISIDQYLYSNVGDSGYSAFVDKEWPTPRKRGDSKVITQYHYYIKDPHHALVVGLKWS